MTFDFNSLSKEDKQTYMLGMGLMEIQGSRAWKFIKTKLLEIRDEANVEDIDVTKPAEEVKVEVAINQFKRSIITSLQTEIKEAIEDANEIKLNNT